MKLEIWVGIEYKNHDCWFAEHSWFCNNRSCCWGISKDGKKAVFCFPMKAGRNIQGACREGTAASCEVMKSWWKQWEKERADVKNTTKSTELGDELNDTWPLFGNICSIRKILYMNELQNGAFGILCYKLWYTGWLMISWSFVIFVCKKGYITFNRNIVNF